MLRDVPVYSLFMIFSFLLLVSACAPTGIYHTVKPGQTLYRIAMTYDVDEATLARVNNIKDPRQLKVNQRVYIPGVSQLRNVPATASASKPTSVTTSTSVHRSSSSTASSSAANKKTAPAAQSPATTKKSAVSGSANAKPVKGLFDWPAKGKILNKFGSQGQKVYKGIEIGIPKGTKVLAAASGKVIYSGNSIPGFGNLVILEHSDSFFSVYGYNQQNLVKMDDFVGQGDKIALSGVPPNGQSARLHFEIRKGKSAVNPILYLP